MPAIITKGAFSAQGYGFGASAASAATYIEDVFSTYIYAGNSASRTITNNIDLSTKGGMVWIKQRNGTGLNTLWDTARGANNFLVSSETGANNSGYTDMLTAFNSGGFSLGADAAGYVNYNTLTYASWTFRKQPKFFDIVTYAGDGVAGRTVAHNLGSEPGMIIVKCTSQASNWLVYHSSTNATTGMFLNATNAGISSSAYWNNTPPTSSVFSLGTSPAVNGAGQTYVAYLFAHNAGGFGAAGTDNVISCGSFTTDASGNATINLGYEPQYILLKVSSTTGPWWVTDNMRGMSQTACSLLSPNNSAAESVSGALVVPTATGFLHQGLLTNNSTCIYMAIRRGPMKTPTDATKVFAPITSSSAAGTAQTTGFPIDAQFMFYRPVGSGTEVADRLRGISSTSTDSGPILVTTSTGAELAPTQETRNWNNTGFQIPAGWSNASVVYESFRRAPGFFDEVCYTGTGDNQSVTHNLGVVPQLIIVKRRSGSSAWFTYNATSGVGKYLMVNDTAAVTTLAAFMSSVTSTAFVPSTNNLQIALSDSGSTYVAYLFATLAGVSKVGSYTGTGAAQNIDCGFAASARFILIKRTDSTGGWYVYDSARGISASNDPYFLLNSTAAEVTNTDYVGTYASGFALTSTAPAGLNANGGSYIFLAVA